VSSTISVNVATTPTADDNQARTPIL
jgi:hypothetical protein